MEEESPVCMRRDLRLWNILVSKDSFHSQGEPGFCGGGGDGVHKNKKNWQCDKDHDF